MTIMKKLENIFKKNCGYTAMKTISNILKVNKSILQTY
jgi:hypothetical protein